MKRTFAALMFVPALACAEFYSGNDLMNKMNDSDTGVFIAMGYIAGVFDSGYGVNHCPPNHVTLGQVRDMVKQMLISYPQIRNFSADSLVMDLLKKTWPCRKGTAV